ncbi:MAG: hypothetical protein RBR78_06580 [Flavobacteriaceae bacterium]|jgi:hypothetical protein|nr:hypothetical protein [Flavobacteriaceae bacterium]
MTSVDFIITELKKLHNKFITSNIRYEFNESTKIHFIEVTPLEFYNSDSYIDSELEFEDLFKERFPEEDVVFISEDSLNKIVFPVFELFAEKTGRFTADCIVLHNTIDFQGINESEYLIAGENNYALAA